MMVLHHPAFTLEQKRMVLELFKNILQQFDGDIHQQYLPDLSCAAPTEACDSGLSVGTEPEVDLISECSTSHRPVEQALPSSVLPTIPTATPGVSRNISLDSSHEEKVTTSESSVSSKPKDTPSDIKPETKDVVNVEHADVCDQDHVSTRIIYNSMFDQPNIVTLNMNAGYLCQSGACHYYTHYPPVISNLAITSVSESSSSEEAQPLKPVPLTTHSPQSSPYASPPHSLSPSRSSSPWLGSQPPSTFSTTVAGQRTSPRPPQRPNGGAYTSAGSTFTHTTSSLNCNSNYGYKGKPPLISNRPRFSDKPNRSRMSPSTVEGNNLNGGYKSNDYMYNGRTSPGRWSNGSNHSNYGSLKSNGRMPSGKMGAFSSPNTCASNTLSNNRDYRLSNRGSTSPVLSQSSYLHQGPPPMPITNYPVYELCRREKISPKHYAQLSEYHINELKQMDDKDLMKMGLKTATITKLRQGLETTNYQRPNGLNVHYSRFGNCQLPPPKIPDGHINTPNRLQKSKSEEGTPVISSPNGEPKNSQAEPSKCDSGRSLPNSPSQLHFPSLQVPTSAAPTGGKPNKESQEQTPVETSIQNEPKTIVSISDSTTSTSPVNKQASVVKTALISSTATTLSISYTKSCHSSKSSLTNSVTRVTNSGNCITSTTLPIYMMTPPPSINTSYSTSNKTSLTTVSNNNPVSTTTTPGKYSSANASPNKQLKTTMPNNHSTSNYIGAINPMTSAASSTANDENSSNKNTATSNSYSNNSRGNSPVQTPSSGTGQNYYSGVNNSVVPPNSSSSFPPTNATITTTGALVHRSPPPVSRSSSVDSQAAPGISHPVPPPPHQVYLINSNGMRMMPYTSGATVSPPTSNPPMMAFIPHNSMHSYIPVHMMGPGHAGSSSYMTPGIYLPPQASHVRSPYPFSPHLPHMPPLPPYKNPQGAVKTPTGGLSNGYKSRKHNKEMRSSDSSPSSSQYSSPPQTPSPDHTNDDKKPNKPDKTAEEEEVDEGWEAADCGGSSMMGSGGSGGSEEGTPPPSAIPYAPHPYGPKRSNRYFHFNQPMLSYHPGYMRHPNYSIGNPPLPPNNHSFNPHVPPIRNAGPPPEKSSREATPVMQTNYSEANSSNNVSQASSGSPDTVVSPASVPGTPVNPCSAVGTSLHYNHPGYPIIGMNPNGMFPHHYPGFPPSHNPNHSMPMSNGFFTHNMPPRFSIPPLAAGMPPADYIYPSYPMMTPTSQASSNCGVGLIPHPANPSIAFNQMYANDVPPGISHSKKTCFNCGQGGHRGVDCSEASIEEMTKGGKVSS